MKKQTLYTAVGQLQRTVNPQGSYPVVIIKGQEYILDLQEMILWTCLSWRLLSLEQLRSFYLQKIEALAIPISRSFDEGVARMVTRGLVASGIGDTDYDALYDLLGNLFIVPVSSSLGLRVLAALKMVVQGRVPLSKVRRLFRKDRPNANEQRVLALSHQALLSTAELIKCVEGDIYDVSTEDKLIEALYGDIGTTSSNIMYLMQSKPSTQSVVTAIVNLYLRQQLIFQRM